MKMLAFALLIAAPASAQIHVNAAAPPGGDGLSWATAWQSLDDALAVANPGNHVWVARGVYRPTVERVLGSPRTASFAPGPGVHMFGGFRGDELALSERTGLIRETILDGDIGTPGVSSDNVTNVVRLEGNGARHWVDGFTIRGGYADGTGLARGGAGLACQIGIKTIRNCHFQDNYGLVGGALLSQISVLQLERCSFYGNRSLNQGGALYATSQFTVTDCLFFGNTAGTRGGAVYANQGGTDIEDVPITRFQNCVFHDNLANRGGAAYVGDPSGPVSAGSVVWSGCTFFLNAAFLDGGAIAVPDTVSPNMNVDIHNSILWGNRAVDGTTLAGEPLNLRSVQHSIVQGGWTGIGNLDANPLFVDPFTRNLSLRPGSPAIDAGSNDLVLRDSNDVDRDGDTLERTPLDRAGRARRFDDPVVPDTGQGPAPVTDMGAYERLEEVSFGADL